MKIIFYQANFCAECGNAMKPRLSLGPRYFCAECGSRIGRRNYFRSAAGLLLCATLAAFAFNKRPPSNIQSNAGASEVSAIDAVTKRGPELKPESVGLVMCGARTKKGKPCRRLVPPGERCAQHRGMASMLDDKHTLGNGN